MVAAVGVEHPLHDDLAPLVLEVDVDVRRLAPLLGDEALEQQIVAAGIDRGDAEHEADRRVGGRPAALAEDVLRAGEADDRVHRQEVRRVAELLDQPQLVLERRAHALGQAFGVALGRARPGQLLQRLLRGERGIVALLGILVGELVEREAAALGDLQRPRQRLRIAAEQPVHLLGRLEVAIGVALAPVAERVDGDVVADAGDDILQDAPAGLVEEHVVGDDRRHPQPRGEVRELVEPELVVRPAPQRERHVGAVAEGLAQAAQPQAAVLVGQVRHEDRDQALAIGDEVVPLEMALPLAGAPLAERQQPAEPGIGRAVGRIDEHRGAVGEVEPAADDEADAGRLGRLVGAHDPGQRIAVDDGQRLDAERGGLLEQLLGRGRAAQEGEMRGHLQLGIARAAHPNTPCRNQRCEPVAASSPSPAR